MTSSTSTCSFSLDLPQDVPLAQTLHAACVRPPTLGIGRRTYSAKSLRSFAAVTPLPNPTWCLGKRKKNIYIYIYLYRNITRQTTWHRVREDIGEEQRRVLFRLCRHGFQNVDDHDLTQTYTHPCLLDSQRRKSCGSYVVSTAIT